MRVPHSFGEKIFDMAGARTVMERIVDAYARLDAGHVKGHIVVAMP